MNPEYIDVFGRRGHPYHAAMEEFPDARCLEFEQLFTRHALTGGESLLDFPAGGGYLARHLGDRAAVTSLEISPGFSEGVEVVQVDDLAGYTGFERVACLAALHHFDEPLAVLGRLQRTLRPGGWLHIADVCDGSPLCEFLDRFVGRYNITGHQGRYLRADPSAYEGLGQVVRCEEVGCPWRFVDEAEMLQFCGALFGLADCPPAALRAALHELVGVRADAQGVALDWRLLYVDIAVQSVAGAVHNCDPGT